MGDPAEGSTPEDNYQIGYGRPPRHSQFRKGQSGNSKGRSKRSKRLEAMLDTQLDRKVSVRLEGRIRKISVLDLIVWNEITRAVKGDPHSVKRVLDYARTRAIPDDFLPDALDLEAFENLAKAALNVDVISDGSTVTSD